MWVSHTLAKQFNSVLTDWEIISNVLKKEKKNKEWWFLNWNLKALGKQLRVLFSIFFSTMSYICQSAKQKRWGEPWATGMHLQRHVTAETERKLWLSRQSSTYNGKVLAPQSDLL